MSLQWLQYKRLEFLKFQVFHKLLCNGVIMWIKKNISNTDIFLNFRVPFNMFFFWFNFIRKRTFPINTTKSSFAINVSSTITTYFLVTPVTYRVTCQITSTRIIFMTLCVDSGNIGIDVIIIETQYYYYYDCQ